jgi:hypothetical protein
LKRNIKRRHTTETEGHKQAEREQSRLLPPMVSTPSMSDHCGELADIVLHTIAPEAAARSNIDDIGPRNRGMH